MPEPGRTWESEDVYTQETNFTMTIMKRARGVYLAHVMEDEHGTEEWDAFPTQGQATKFCRDWVGTSLRWSEVQKPGYLPMWRASYTRIQRRKWTGGYEPPTVTQERWVRDAD